MNPIWYINKPFEGLEVQIKKKTFDKRRGKITKTHLKGQISE